MFIYILYTKFVLWYNEFIGGESAMKTDLYSFGFLDEIKKGTPKEIVMAYRKAMYEQFETASPLPAYENEVVLFQCVKAGNIEELDRILKTMTPRSQPTGHMSTDPLKQAQFIVVSGITLATRYALAGGLPEPDAFHLSDAYLQRLNSTIKEEDAIKLFIVALHDFTKRVHDIKETTHYSYPITRSIRYISSHLHSKCSLINIAQYCNLTPQYLSALFHKETGLTISTYVRNEKLKVSAQMLRYSDFSISRIASMLDFPSASAFTSDFKKYFNITPKAYRNSVPAEEI